MSKWWGIHSQLSILGLVLIFMYFKFLIFDISQWTTMFLNQRHSQQNLENLDWLIKSITNVVLQLSVVLSWLLGFVKPHNKIYRGYVWVQASGLISESSVTQHLKHCFHGYRTGWFKYCCVFMILEQVIYILGSCRMLFLLLLQRQPRQKAWVGLTSFKIPVSTPDVAMLVLIFNLFFWHISPLGQVSASALLNQHWSVGKLGARKWNPCIRFGAPLTLTTR